MTSLAQLFAFVVRSAANLCQGGSILRNVSFQNAFLVHIVSIMSRMNLFAAFISQNQFSAASLFDNVSKDKRHLRNILRPST
jgi:hypothetical protein